MEMEKRGGIILLFGGIICIQVLGFSRVQIKPTLGDICVCVSKSQNTPIARAVKGLWVSDLVSKQGSFQQLVLILYLKLYV